jgi:osmotically-inducible protein OsmY
MKNLKLAFLILFLIVFSIFSYGFNFSTSPEKEGNLTARIQDLINKSSDNPSIEVINNGNGNISLKGSVNTLYEKLRLFEKVSKVKGVNDIADLLDINTAPVPDDIIKQKIEEDLHISRSILEPDRIKVAVDNGEVILNGVVSYPKEKEMAETIASWQNGVFGIMNNITVLSKNKAVDNKNLDIVLGEILKNQFGLEKGTRFKVDNGNVTLSGTVTSNWAKENIMKDFFQVPGVDFIKNDLRVVQTIS